MQSLMAICQCTYIALKASIFIFMYIYICIDVDKLLINILFFK